MKLDAILILGKELKRDPERGRRELAARAAAASVALREGAEWVATLEARLKGQEASGSAMVVDFLSQLGVEPSQMIVEETTRSTREEARIGAALARERGVRRLAVVTASYHVPRVRQYFARVLDPGQFAVIAPENFLQRAGPVEADWIRAGTPDAETLESEGRVEGLLSVLGTVAQWVPGGDVLESAAAGLLRQA